MKQPQTITEPSKSMGTEGGEMHQGAPASGGIPRLRTAAAESAGMRTADVSLLFGGRHCHRMRLFHLHSTVKIQPFSLSLSLSLVFPLAESIAKAFGWLFLWSFKEKSISRFLWHSLREKVKRSWAGKLRRCSLRDVDCHTLFSRTSTMNAVIFFRKISSEKLSACLFSLSRAHACSVEAS